MRHTADEHTDDNRLVATELGIGDITTQNREHIGQEDEEQVQRRRRLHTHTQRTGGLLRATRRRTRTITTFRQRVLDEIGEDTRDTIVTGTLGELDNAEGVADPWDLTADLAEGVHLVFGGNRATRHGLAASGFGDDGATTFSRSDCRIDRGLLVRVHGRQHVRHDLGLGG